MGHRYYNPERGRWIQPADVSTLNPSSINGLNLYSYANNNPIGIVYRSSGVGVSVVNQLINQKFSLLMVNIFGINKNNYNSSVHWKNEWFAKDWPSFLLLTKDSFKVLDWSISLYKGSLYFDNNEEHSIYVSVGNIGAYAGINYKKGIGLDVSANVAEIGYDGRIIDANFEVLSIGFTYMYKDGKLELKHGYVLWGWSLSIDFVELWKCLFGGE